MRQTPPSEFILNCNLPKKNYIQFKKTLHTSNSRSYNPLDTIVEFYKLLKQVTKYQNHKTKTNTLYLREPERNTNTQQQQSNFHIHTGTLHSHTEC